MIGKKAGRKTFGAHYLHGKELPLRKEYKRFVLLSVFLLMLFQMGSIFLLNYKKAMELLDYDSALTMRHIIEMWRSRTIFLRDYVYTSTLEIDSVAFFVMPFYLLFGQVGLFLGIGHVCFYLVTALVLCDLFHQFGRSRILGLAGTVLLYTPYAFGQLDWDNMLFFSVGQYSFRVLLLFLFADLFFDSAETKGQSYYIRFLLCCLLNFWTSLSCGNYVLLSMLSPFILYCILGWVTERVEKPDRARLLFLLVSIALSLAGYVLHNILVGVSINNDKNLVLADDFMRNLENCVTGVFMLFGGLSNEEGVSVFSVNGLLRIFKFALVLLAVIAAVKKHDGKRSKLQLITLLTAGVNLAMLILADTSYGPDIFEYRYHILWCSLLLLCLAGYYFDPGKRLAQLLSVGLLIALAAVNVFSVCEIMALPDQDVLSRDIIAVADEYGIGSLYLWDMPRESNVIRFLDSSKYCNSLTIADGRLYADTVYFYEGYGDNMAAGSENLLIATKEQFEALPEKYAACYTCVEEMFDRNVYYTASNPFDVIAGPPTGIFGVSADFPYTFGYTYEEGAEGFSLYGPKVDVEEGCYDISFYYTPLTEIGTDSYFDISADSGGTVLGGVHCENGKRVVSVNDFYIPASENVEFRLFTAEGDSIAVEKIVFEKKS